jgi:outer membrane protein TolC
MLVHCPRALRVPSPAVLCTFLHPTSRQHRRCRAALVIALLATLAWPARATPLALDDALRLAQERSRQLVAQAAGAGAAREMAAAAGELPDPVVKAGITNLPINGTDRLSLTRDFMTMRSVGVMQEFTREGKRQARAARFAREAELAESGRAVALSELRRDTAMAWVERSVLERMREALQAQRAEATLQIEAADAAYRGGRGAQADVFAARSALALIDDRIRHTERQIATATTRLGRRIGADAAARALAAAPAMESSALHADNLEAKLPQHPQIAQMLKQEALAQAEADVARSGKQSDWSVEVMYSQRGPAYSNMVSINLSVPLQWDQKNRQDREVAAKLALLEQMRAQREEAAREIAAQIHTAWQEWQSNRHRLTHYDTTLQPLAAERTRAALAAYRGGSGPLTAVLEARRMEIDLRMERLNLEMQTASLWAQLEYLIPTDRDAVATK